MSLRVIITTVVVALLHGCTNAAPRSIAFTQDSAEALVVFGFHSEVRAPISLTIAQFDRAAARVSANSFAGQYFVEHSKPQLAYYVMQVPPDTYAVKNIAVHRSSMTIICLSEGTLSFEVQRGQQLYLGNFMFDGQEINQVASDIESAREMLKSYPKVQEKLAAAELRRITFKNSSRLGAEICGG